MAGESKPARRLIADPNLLMTSYNVNDSLSFALVGRTQVGLVQATKFFGCRDYLQDSVRFMIHGVDENGGCNYRRGNDPKIIMDEFRLLITSAKKGIDVQFRIDTAKRIIHAYEDLAGFSTKMKVARVTHAKYPKSRVWLFTGDARWISYAQLMSVVTLIIRFCVLRAPHLAEEVIKDVATAERYIHQQIKAARLASGYVHSDVTNYMPNLMKVLRHIMADFNYYFDLPVEEAYPIRVVGNSWHSAGGANAMATSNTTIASLDRKVMELRKKLTESKS